MRTQEALELEELTFEEAPDVLATMTLPDLRRYVTDAFSEEVEMGLRSALENPETLRSFRRPSAE